MQYNMKDLVLPMSSKSTRFTTLMTRITSAFACKCVYTKLLISIYKLKHWWTFLHLKVVHLLKLVFTIWSMVVHPKNYFCSSLVKNKHFNWKSSANEKYMCTYRSLHHFFPFIYFSFPTDKNYLSFIEINAMPYPLFKAWKE